MQWEWLWGLGGLGIGGFIGFWLGRWRPRREEWNQAVQPLLSALVEAEPGVARGERLALDPSLLDAFRQVASRREFYRFTSGIEYVNLQLAAAHAAHHDREERQLLLDQARVSLANLQDSLRRR